MVAALFSASAHFQGDFYASHEFASTKRGNGVAPKGEMIPHQKGKSRSRIGRGGGVYLTPSVIKVTEILKVTVTSLGHGQGIPLKPFGSSIAKSITTTLEILHRGRFHNIECSITS